ncbi:MAG: restriction endonuclease subunit S [Proteobacteria bacterium]|nr:restriction endonuclease subunit S [Pseudomonadota bacterium]
MTPGEFLNEFGAVANAPGGVQRLREMILQLAVQGKLVEQNPEDEPASELLKKIESKIKLIVEKKEINKPKPLPKISENLIPWKIPQSWKWTRLGDVTSYAGAQKTNPSDINPETWVLELEDVEKITSKILRKVQFKDRISKSTKSVFQKGDVLYGKLRPYLDKVVVADENGVCTTEMIPLNGYGILNNEYIRWFLKSPWFIKYSNNSTHGMNLPRLGTEKARNAYLSIPPLEEQKRIVAKVDQLMALCDQLEAQQQKRSTLVKHTRISALEALAHAQGGDELQTAWKRVEENLSMLFEHPDDVEDLKKCVLQNAVMGKLVAQNPDDEPASELLKKIAKEKAELAQKGEIKKPYTLSPITDAEKPFKIPRGWTITRFVYLANEIATGPFGSIIHKSDYIENGVPLINPSHMINSKIVENMSVSISKKKAVELEAYSLNEGDIVMARRGEMGRCALVTKRESGWLCGTGSFVLKFHKTLSREYILLLFRTEWVRTYLGGNSVGATMTNLNHGILNRMPILLPPIAEQKRIVKKTQSLLSLCDTLQKQLAKSRKVAEQLAQSIVESITGMSTEKQEPMKAPKTELVSRLKLAKKPGMTDHAPLSAILVKNNDELSAKALWNNSGLPIDGFYRQLKIEMVKGWIDEPEKAKILEVDGQGKSQ